MKEEFTITSDVKQSDALSETLFSLALQYAVGKLGLRGHMFQRIWGGRWVHMQMVWCWWPAM